MNRTKLWGPGLSVALLMIGCSDGDGGGHSGPKTLKIETGGPPSYVAVRDRGAEWTELAVAGQSSFEVTVAEEYEAVVLCDSTSGRRRTVSLRHSLRTTEDEMTLTHQCGTREQVAVSGLMVQAGVLAVGDKSATEGADNWDFTLLTPTGTYDLLMMGSSGGTKLTHAGVRRNLEVTGDLDLGVVDFANETMRPLETKTYTASNAQPDEFVNGSVTAILNGTSWLFFDQSRGDDVTVDILPKELVASSGRQIVTVEATAATGPSRITKFRSRSADAHGDQALALPEAMGEATFDLPEDRTAATWSYLPKHDALTLSRSVFNPDATMKWQTSLEMTRSYEEATSAQSLELDISALPGFKDEWRNRLESFQNASLAASTGSKDSAERSVSSIHESF